VKTVRLVLITALTLCSGTVSTKAHGGDCWWPAVAFGLGLGINLAASYHATYNASVSTSAYSYSPPSYAYHPGRYYVASASAPAVTRVTPASTETRTVVAPTGWVPSAPGPGKWVLDPHPYRYTPTTVVAAVKPPATNSITTVVRLAGEAPRYINQPASSR